MANRTFNVLKYATALLAIGATSITYAYIDERTPQPAKNAAPNLIVDIEVNAEQPAPPAAQQRETQPASTADRGRLRQVAPPPAFLTEQQRATRTSSTADGKFKEADPSTTAAPQSNATNSKLSRQDQVGISGDFSSLKWAERPVVTDKPVALSEALLTLHFPVTNQVVELNIEPYLLQKKVSLKGGVTRKEILEDIAKQTQSHIYYENNIITLNTLGVGEQTDIVYDAGLKGEVAMIDTTIGSSVPSQTQFRGKSWQANAGSTLRQTVEQWSRSEGWQLRWEAQDLDYPIVANFSVNGQYIDAISQTFELYENAQRPFKVDIYPTQKLTVVMEKK